MINKSIRPAIAILTALVVLFSNYVFAKEKMNLCGPILKHVWTKEIRKLGKGEDYTLMKVYSFKDKYLVNLEIKYETRESDFRWLRTELYLIDEMGNVIWKQTFPGYKYGNDIRPTPGVFVENENIFRLFKIYDTSKNRWNYYLVKLDLNGKITNEYKSSGKEPKLINAQIIKDKKGNDYFFYIKCSIKRCDIDYLSSPIRGINDNKWKKAITIHLTNGIRKKAEIVILGKNSLLLIERDSTKRGVFNNKLIRYAIPNKILLKKDLSFKTRALVIIKIEDDKYFYFVLPKEAYAKRDSGQSYYRYAYIGYLDSQGRQIEKKRFKLPEYFYSQYIGLGRKSENGFIILGNTYHDIWRKIVIFANGETSIIDKTYYWIAGIIDQSVFRYRYGHISRCKQK